MDQISKFIKRYKGSSFPVEIETRNNTTCIIKMSGAGNGPQSLIAEFIVNHMCSRAGLPAPAVCVVEIPKDFPWDFGTDEFDDIVQKSFGPNLGIALIPEAEPITSFSQLTALPETFLKEMVTVDSFFRNFDRTEDSSNVLKDKNGKPWMIDHGGCTFLESQGLANNLSLPQTHMLKSAEDKYFSLDLMNRIVTDELVKETVTLIPEEWLRSVSLSRDAIEQLILGRRDHYILNWMIRF